jgi:uncharacterized protein YoxC
MKVRDYITALLLTLAIILSLNAICGVQEINKALDIVLDTQESHRTKINTIEGNLYPEKINGLETQIDTLKTIVNEYSRKVDDMTFSYTTLDEILKQMTGEAQKRYARGYR